RDRLSQDDDIGARLNSTGLGRRRQGKTKHGAGAGARDKRQLAAMRPRQFARDRQAETAAARPGGAEERTEQVVTRLGRQARTIVSDLDRDRAGLATGRDPQPLRSGLDRVAGEVREYAVELVAIGLDDELGRERAVDDEPGAGVAEAGTDLGNQR